MMRTMDKKTVDYDMDLLPDSVLYDIFYESATRLGGAYAARAWTGPTTPTSRRAGCVLR